MKKIIMPVCRILIVLIGITFFSFSLMYLGPGDPAEKYLAGGDGNKGTVSEEAIQAQREKWGLDKPFLVQYGVWLGRVFHGNLGNSYSTGRPVLQELTKKAGPTASLAFASMLVCIIVSVPLGVLCAYRKDGVIDNISRIFSIIGISLPSFLVSLILLYILSVHYHWFSISGENGIKGLLLPMAVLAFQSSAKLTRQVRSVVLTELGRPYVQGALARVIGKNRILF